MFATSTAGSIFALVAATLASAKHISERTDIPTIITVPELHVRRPGFASLANFSSVHVGLSHSFTGLTDIGYIEYRYNALQKPGSIHVEDYADLFSAASMMCASVASTSTTEESDIDDMQNQMEVKLSINFGVLSANDDVALSHFMTRVTSSIAFLTFDPIIHAENPSFARGTSCSVLLPWERAVYNVTSVIILDSRTLQLTLKTASVRDTHAMLDVTLKWDPNAAREVARRRAAGEPLGEDVRRRTRGRDLADTVTGTGSVSINWNGQTGAAAAATVDSIDVIPPAPGLMTCKNCFAYIAASYSVTFQVCAGLDAAQSSDPGLTWIFTTQDASGTLGYDENGNLSPQTTYANMADCVAALAPWMASTSASPVNRPPGTNAITIANRFNAAFNVNAYVGGDAAFNFLLSSGGYSASGSTASCNFAAGATDSSTCRSTGTTTQLFSTPSSPAFTIPITTGVSATVTGSVSAAAIYSGAIAGKLSFGAAASAHAKLGGYFQVVDAIALGSGKLQPVLGAYTQFDLSYTPTPFELTLTDASATLDVTVFTDVVISVDQAIPITATASTRFSGAMSAGTLNRRLGPAGQRESVARRLDSSATCNTSDIFFTATNAGFVGATVGPVSANTLVEGIAGASGFALPSVLTEFLPSTVIIPATAVVPLTTANGPVQNLLAICLTKGVTVGGFAGGSSSNSHSNAPAYSTCGGGCGAGIFFALVFVLGIAAGVFYYKMYYQKKKPLPCVVPACARRKSIPKFWSTSTGSSPSGVEFSNPIPHAVDVSVVSWGVKGRKVEGGQVAADTAVVHEQ